MRRRPGDDRGPLAPVEDDLPELGPPAGRRLVVERAGLPGSGRLEAVAAALAIVVVIGGGLVLARAGANGPPAPFSSTPHPADASAALEASTLPLAAGPTPEVTPAFPCFAGRDPRPPLAILVGVDGFGVTGRWRFAASPEPATSEVSPDDPVLTGVPVDTPLEIDLVAGRCALAWEISVAGAVVEHEDGPPDASRAAQDRFRFYLPSVTRAVPVRADLTFPEGVVHYAWTVEPATKPVALVGPTGRTPTAVIGEPGCLIEVRGPGPSASPADAAACSSDYTPIAVNSLFATAGDDIPFAVPGWTIVSLSARCQPTPSAPGRCTLETHDTIADGVRLITTPPGPSPAVRVDAVLERTGVTYRGSFFFEILPG